MKCSVTPYEARVRVPMRSEDLFNAAGLLFALGIVVWMAKQS